MAVTLRADKGSALTFSELDANFTDYKTFRDTFDRTLWINANDGKVLYWNEANAKVEARAGAKAGAETEQHTRYGAPGQRRLDLNAALQFQL